MLNDPRTFYIPSTTRKCNFRKALCDLRATINLMILFVYNKLGLGEMKLITMSMLLVDDLIKHHKGIIKDVLVKGDKLISLC